MKTTTLLLLTVVLSVFRLQAQVPGALDSTFSTDGKLRIDFNGSYETGVSLLSLPDGKTVIGGATYLNGDYDYTLVKLTQNGTYDSTFGTNGITITRLAGTADFMTNMELQPDGKILCTGYCNSCSQHYWYVLRYHANGVIDSSFGTNGISTSFKSTSFGGAADIEVLPDSSILLCGHMNTPQGYQMTVVKLESNGRVDSTFGTVGAVVPYFGYFQCSASRMQIVNGKILLAGVAENNMITNRNFALVQLQASGLRDSTFGTNGVVITDFDSLNENIMQIAIQPDGKIVAAGMTGYINTNFAMARYHANGSIDSSFGINGLVENNISQYSDYITDVVLQPDGKIVVGARTDNNLQQPHNSNPIDFIVARYTSAGVFDNTFGTNGRVVTNFGTFNTAMNRIALAPNNKLVVVGSGFDNTLQTTDMLVARYYLGPDTTPTACVNTSASFTETICKGNVYSFNGTNLFAAGIYTDTIPNSGGCDSVMQLTLLVDSVIHTISFTPVSISVPDSSDSYQWVNCTTGLPVQGATDYIFTPLQTGTYKCVVTKGLCTDTTICFTVTVVSGIAHLSDNLRLYPNPATEQFTIVHESETPVEVFIHNASGQLVRNFITSTTTTTHNISTMPKGIYHVTLSGNNLFKVLKLVKW